MLDVLEVMRCMLLCMLETVEDGLCLLEAVESGLSSRVFEVSIVADFCPKAALFLRRSTWTLWNVRFLKKNHEIPYTCSK